MADSLKDAVRALTSGRLVIIPTDTVWGIALSVAHSGAPTALYQAKGRDEGKPVAWLVGSTDDLRRFGRDVPSYAMDLASELWAGPLTIVVEASDEVPSAYASHDGSIGLRMPGSDTVLGLIHEVGSPLAVTSANRSGMSPVPSSQPFDPEASGMDGLMLLDVDGAQAPIGADLPSTVVDCRGSEPHILRSGSIGEDVIRRLSRSPRWR